VGGVIFLAVEVRRKLASTQHSIGEGGEVSGEIPLEGEGETNLKYGVENLMVVINSGAVVKVARHQHGACHQIKMIGK
jgi:hypothetical protein